MKYLEVPDKELLQKIITCITINNEISDSEVFAKVEKTKDIGVDFYKVEKFLLDYAHMSNKKIYTEEETEMAFFDCKDFIMEVNRISIFQGFSIIFKVDRDKYKDFDTNLFIDIIEVFEYIEKNKNKNK